MQHFYLMTPVLATLVYCLRDGEVLLIERHKEPNEGLWVGLGGKIEADESPYECAQRELYEEAGFYARHLIFRGLITLISPRPDWHWILFIYAVTDFTGELKPDEREGYLHWWPVTRVPQLTIPQADAIFFSHVTALNEPFYHAKFVYDADLKLTRIQQHPG